jgi:hypothetical protein
MALPTPPTAEEVLATINSVPARKRLYAPSGSATIDNTYVNACIAEVWSEAHALTAEAFPNGLRNADGSIDAFLFGYIADMCHGKAAGRHLNATDGSGYARAAKLARDNLRTLKKDDGLRRTEGVGQPTAAVLATPDPPATPWSNAANGKCWSGF